MDKKSVFITTYLIQERSVGDPPENTTIHRINVDCDKKDPRGGWYRQVSSLNSFHSRLNKRFSKHWYTKERIHLKPQIKYGRADCMTVESLKIFCRGINKYGKKSDIDIYPKVRWKNWATIWDFYDHIGFDYKNKSVKELDKMVLLHAC